MAENQSGWQAVLPGVSAAVGIVLVAVGMLLPGMSNSASAVTDKQASEYFAASRAVEEAAAATSKRTRQREPATSPEQARELQAARDRFAAAREEVESAKASRQSLAWWMKLGGALFVAIGLGGLMLQKSSAN